ncbi:MAG TPA: hypothetical protein VFC19_24630, partial [Candidatus Limnocylindrales bacterium]|nr:hypothetical protein [Candidatus Limnocylindrales bacterium]
MRRPPFTLRRKAPTRSRLRVESLEDRSVPSVANVFEIDGNTKQDAILPPPDDWDTLYNGGANNGGSPLAFTGIVNDSTPDAIFTGGASKDIFNINLWRWTTGGPPNKDDIINSYGAAYSANDELNVFVGQDRLVTNGAATLGFWFFQQEITTNPDGTFNGTHTVGDILLVIDYSGGVGTVHTYAWHPGWDPAHPTDNLQPLPDTGEYMAAGNAGSPINAAWRNGIPQNGFFEAGVNLTKILPAGADLTFTSFMAVSRSSASANSTLQDFMLGKLDFTTGPKIQIVKKINGDDANTAPGPTVLVGSPVTFTYEVKNIGTPRMSPPVVRDDNGTPGVPGDDFTSASVLVGGFNIGDTNTNGVFDPGETWHYTATATAVVGQYTNIATATGTAFNGKSDIAFDLANYFGMLTSTINLVKTANPTTVNEGATGPVTYSYAVTNSSPQAAIDPLTVNSLIDDNGTPSNTGDDVSLVIGGVVQSGVTLVKTGGDQDNLLEAGEIWTYGKSFAIPAQNANTSRVNIATVTGQDVFNSPVSAQATATVTYTDVLPSIAISKAASPATISEGHVGVQSVTYTYTVTNSSPASTDPLTLTSLADDKAGNLLAAFIAANGNSNLLAPGASVTFTVTQALPTANAAASYTNVVTVNAHDDENDPASAQATATVTYLDVQPTIDISKAVAPGSINEGGVGNQNVTYTYTVKNTSLASTDPVTVTSLVDDKAGDLLAAFMAANGGSAVLASGASVFFTVNQHLPVQNADGSYTNIVTVTGHDDENDTTSDSATATVQYDDVAPTIDITKSVSPGSINEGGVGNQNVTYTYTVHNTSLASTDPVTVTSLADDKAGDLLAAFIAANGGSAVLAPGASVTFSVTQALPVGNAGASYTNVVTALGHDDEQDP